MPLLLRVTGQGWTAEIFGKMPELPPFLKELPQSSLPTEQVSSVEVYSAATGELATTAPGTPVPPLFFESTTYDVYFEADDATTSINLPPGSTQHRARPHSSHHTINFRNHVGFAEVSISSPSGHSSIRLEVFPRKLDYRDDYTQMREEVSAILRNLAMAANARTYGLAKPTHNHRPTLVEWFALTQHFFDDFIKLATSIAKRPHSALAKTTNIRATDRARCVSKKTLARSMRHNSGASQSSHTLPLPRRIAEDVSARTYDTPENRYYKALLKATHSKLRKLATTDRSGDEDADWLGERTFFDSIRPTVESMQRRLEAILRSPHLSTVTESVTVRPDSMVLHVHPQYSRFDRLSRLLNGGLSFADDIVPIGVKDTAVLYEYWCFLTIVTLLQRRFELVQQDLVRFRHLKTTVTLAKGHSATVRFIHRSSKKEMRITYNRLFPHLPTIDQKPDNVIQFSSDTRLYIFDAKYRLQFDREYISRYGGPGPKTDDINTMHRYRDAIVIPPSPHAGTHSRGIVAGAVVLFPLPEETTYQTHRFFKSIDAVEIGGLPFLPRTTQLVEDKLDKLLATDYPD